MSRVIPGSRLTSANTSSAPSGIISAQPWEDENRAMLPTNGSRPPRAPMVGGARRADLHPTPTSLAAPWKVLARPSRAR
eukprot:15480842-Alexandrium_andersonii.AAC.1